MAYEIGFRQISSRSALATLTYSDSAASGGNNVILQPINLMQRVRLYPR